MSKSNKQQEPKIRFEAFSGSWEKDILGKTKDVRDGTHDSPKLISEGYPLVTSKNLKENGLDMSDISYISEVDYKSINKRSEVTIGDILFAMIGTIGNPIIIKQDNFAIKNVALIKNTGAVSNEFLLPLLKSDVFEKYIYIENAGNTQKFLALGKIREFSFHVPTTNEQTQIGNFFQQLDKLIELQTRAVESAETYKKAMLQKMFPQKGGKVPRVRFAGFSGDWEQGRLSEVVKINPSSQLPTTFNYVDLESVKGHILIGVKKEFLETAPSRAQRVAIKNDIFYQTVRPYQRNNYLFELEDNDYVFSTGYAQLRPKKVISSFLFSVIRTSGFVGKVLIRCTGTSYPAINSTDLGEINILFPTLEEQTKIGDFFQKLDQNIESEKKKLERYQTMKRAMLQRMFV